VRVGPLEPKASPPSGAGAAPRRPRWEFESLRGDEFGPVRIWEAGRLSTAQGEFDSRPDRNTRQGIPTSRGRRLRPGVLQVQILSLVPVSERAPSPTGRGCLLKPGTVGVRISGRARARSTTEVQPHDEQPTRGSTPPAPTNVTSRTGSVTSQWGGRGFESRRAKARSSVEEHQSPSAKTMFVTLRNTGVLRRRRVGSEPASRRFESVPRFHGGVAHWVEQCSSPHPCPAPRLPGPKVDGYR
jgi:hypothetical protein